MDDLRYEVIEGDCLASMAAMDAGSVHAVVCDPPYGLGFMGKGWDHAVPGAEYWAAALRVARPGAHLLAFGGTRLWHRLATAIEDAGWEVRDTMMWMYGSGFPKSLDIGKAIDRAAGVEREVVGLRKGIDTRQQNPSRAGTANNTPTTTQHEYNITAPATEAARQWDGWGTALKPAWEPVVVARKPMGSTVAACITAHGTGGINVGGCRIDWGDDKPTQEQWNRLGSSGGESKHMQQKNKARAAYAAGLIPVPPGRWPSNVLLDPGAGALLDREAGDDGGGGPSRFFYCGKATREDRDDGLEDVDPQFAPTMGNGIGGKEHDPETATPKRNAHPTVKPTALMRYLCRLVTPPGGVILDPFCGSGSTGRAALLEGFHFVGCELDPEHAAVARKRIAAALGPSLFARAVDMGAVRN